MRACVQDFGGNSLTSIMAPVYKFIQLLGKPEFQVRGHGVEGLRGGYWMGVGCGD